MAGALSFVAIRLSNLRQDEQDQQNTLLYPVCPVNPVSSQTLPRKVSSPSPYPVTSSACHLLMGERLGHALLHLGGREVFHVAADGPVMAGGIADDAVAVAP